MRRLNTAENTAASSAPVQNIAAIAEEDEFRQIAENGGLAADQMMAALLEACGAKPKEISRRLGKGDQYVYQIRERNPNYPPVVRQLQGLVARRVVSQVSDVNALFNGQIGDSVATLMEIRDNVWAKDENRIRASLAFLDRAPDAPKTTTQVDQRSVSIQIPLSTMQGMQQALEEDRGVEGQEILELSRIGGGGRGGRSKRAEEGAEGERVVEDGTGMIEATKVEV